jgi:hypothetical protein
MLRNMSAMLLFAPSQIARLQLYGCMYQDQQQVFASCSLQVESPGTYYAVMFYTSKYTGNFKLSIGPYADIQAGKAPTVKAQLPPMVSCIVFGSITACSETMERTSLHHQIHLYRSSLEDLPGGKFAAEHARKCLPGAAVRRLLCVLHHSSAPF